jgi:hypothetical protein
MRNAGVKGTEAEPDDRNLTSFSQIRDLLQGCKSLARTIKSGRPIRCLLSLAELSPPPREVADLMVDRYFAYFESAHRILHEPTFRKNYQNYWERPETTTTKLRLSILLVVGIGSSLQEYTDMKAEVRDMVHHGS